MTRKYLSILTIMLFSLVWQTSPISAVTTKPETKGEISFYTETDDDTNDGGNNTGTNNNTSSGTENGRLPNTGDMNMRYYFYGSSVLCIIAGMMIYCFKKNRKTESKKMKKLTLCATLLLGVSTLGSAFVSAQDLNTTGKVTFEEGTSVGPLNPDDPQTDPDDPTKPLDPDETPEDGEGETGTGSGLNLDFVSHFNFGTVKIAAGSKTYFSNGTKLQNQDYVQNYLQISDLRGTGAGWNLQVSRTQFVRTDDSLELTGAVLGWTDGSKIGANGMTDNAPTETVADTIGIGTNTVVYEAAVGNGLGTWLLNFGDKGFADPDDATDYGKGVYLTVPGGVARTGEYTSTITWSLVSGPAA